MSVEKGKRLDSLDALRGLTMFWITGGATLVSALALLVTGDKNAWLCQQMTHVPWAGLHIYDLIFPTFLFITGVTFPFSTAKRLERGDSKSAIAWNILRRALVLIALGAVYEEIQKLDWAHFRVWSVIGRIGLVWGVAALMTLCCRLRTCVAVALIILVGWWLFYRWVPAPGGEWGVNYLVNPKDAFARWFDAHYLTTAHRGEGGVTSIAMLPTAFLGIWAGQYRPYPWPQDPDDAGRGAGDDRARLSLGVAVVGLPGDQELLVGLVRACRRRHLARPLGDLLLAHRR